MFYFVARARFYAKIVSCVCSTPCAREARASVFREYFCGDIHEQQMRSDGEGTEKAGKDFGFQDRVRVLRLLGMQDAASVGLVQRRDGIARKR